MKRTLSLFSATALILAGLSSGIGVANATGGKTIFVKDSGSGDGSSVEQAYGSLDTAIQNAADGDVIQIEGTVTRQGGTDLKIDKAVTIQGGTLVLRTDSTKKTYITKDVTFKNIQLESRPESNSAFRIFANGHKLTFDNVTTVNNTSSNAPTIYTGAVKEKDGVGNKAEVTVQNSPANTQLAGVITSDEDTNSPTNIDATVNLKDNVVLPQGADIVLGPNSADKVILNLHNANFNKIIGTDAPNNRVNMQGGSVEADIIDVPALSLLEGNLVLGPLSTLTENVQVQTGTNLDVRKPMAARNGVFEIPGNLVGEGNILINGGQSTLQINGKSAIINVIIQNVDKANEPLNDHQYVAYIGNQVTLKAANAAPEGCTYNFGNGIAEVECREVNKTASLSVVKVGEDDPVIVLDNVEFEGDFTAANLFSKLVDELKKNPTLVVLTEDRDNAPVVEDGQAKTIEWKAKEAGSFQVTGGQKVPFTVETTADGQVVSYTLPAAPQGKQYKDKTVTPEQKVVVTGEDRFLDKVFELEEIPAAPEDPKEDPNAPGNGGQGDNNPGTEQPGGDNAGDNAGDNGATPGDGSKPDEGKDDGNNQPGDNTKPGGEKPGDNTKPGDSNQPGADSKPEGGKDESTKPAEPVWADIVLGTQSAKYYWGEELKATFTMPKANGETEVIFYLHSSPLKLGKQALTTLPDGSVLATVSWKVPTDFPVGAHHIVVTDVKGKELARVGVEILKRPAKAQTPVATTVPVAVPPRLANTGTAAAALAVLAGLLGLVGIAGVVTRRKHNN
ncbi:LPXTG cell wall anchor domain-containing protein [Gleimia coleocanis]|nr:LPXTG cell wall anchor domain-containing protein [Gleimia coleocanis]